MNFHCTDKFDTKRREPYNIRTKGTETLTQQFPFRLRKGDSIDYPTRFKCTGFELRGFDKEVVKGHVVYRGGKWVNRSGLGILIGKRV